jgi:hypothetical protein
MCFLIWVLQAHNLFLIAQQTLQRPHPILFLLLTSVAPFSFRGLVFVLSWVLARIQSIRSQQLSRILFNCALFQKVLRMDQLGP